MSQNLVTTSQMNELNSSQFLLNINFAKVNQLQAVVCLNLKNRSQGQGYGSVIEQNALHVKIQSQTVPPERCVL